MKQSSPARTGRGQAPGHDQSSDLRGHGAAVCAEKAQPPDRDILREHLFQQFSTDGKTGGYPCYLWENHPAIERGM